MDLVDGKPRIYLGSAEAGVAGLPNWGLIAGGIPFAEVGIGETLFKEEVERLKAFFSTELG